MTINEKDLYDEWCDPNNIHILRFEEIAAAAYRIKYGVEKTPCTVCILIIEILYIRRIEVTSVNEVITLTMLFIEVTIYSVEITLFTYLSYEFTKG